VRVTQAFPAVEQFLRSGRAEGDIVLAPGPQRRGRRFSAPQLRAVRRVGPSGEVQVFLTTLPRHEFSHTDICDLYRRRWQIELFYRLEKSDYVGHHQFHAKYPEGVRQEVFAFLLFTAITRTLMAAAAKTAKAPYERISQKSSILATARVLTVLLLRSEPDQARRILAQLLRHIAGRLDPTPRQRACERRSFKPRSRWGPNGHRRAMLKKAGVR
jgi:hypothetical protein